MGEGNKQVRVDNWGIFFLQRLQMFFNKTDYCDLTLQFEGNVQLKVHRLVMNACTEYFQVLEQTCEMIDDVLIMPPDLQADVVLPIVNFMYTGMLEFHMSIFDKLYKTANLMNITVLTKLLDAQKTPVSVPKVNAKKTSHPSHATHTWNLHGKRSATKAADLDLPATLPGRKLPIWKRKSAPIAVPHTVVSHLFPEQKRSIAIDPLGSIDNAPKPTRFEWPEEELTNLNIFDSNFDEISYSSKPLLTQEDEPRPSTSFDRVKDTPDSTKKSSNYNHSAIDMEEVKDYVKEQKIRSNMAEDDDEDVIENDFENDVHTDSSQDSQKRKLKIEVGQSKRVRFSVNEKENQVKHTKINITPTGKTTTDVDHTKIISEVLKKYPNLVKKNKNIRLKILAKTNTNPNVADQVKKAPLKKITPKIQLQSVTSPPASKIIKSTLVEESNEDGPWKCQRCSTPSEPVEFVLYYLYRKHMTDVHNEKFDSRMCKFCGHKSTKHNMLMYHQYTKHGVKPPPAYTFPKCSQCPYIALTEVLLIKHKMNHTKHELQCSDCKLAFVNKQALTSHIQITGHIGKSNKCNYDCQYCTKKFPSGSHLFSHIRLQHRDEARRDGIVSIDETVDYEDEEEEEEEMDIDNQELDQEQESYITSDIHDKKIKILSDVKLSSMEVQQSNSQTLSDQNITLEPSSEAEALSNVATGIATSLGLVDVVVLDENQQFILHTDNEENITNRESEFILPDLQDTQTFTTAQQVISSEQNVLTQSMLHSSDIGSTDELVMVLTDHDYGDGNNEVINDENSKIVVLYSHPVEGQENQFITTSPGNIMLTSQAGLIELRNTNAIVTSNSSQFITGGDDRSENTQIESIEMIQREINQHPDTKGQIELSENVKSEISENVTNVSENTDQVEMLPTEELQLSHESTSEVPEPEVENGKVTSEDATTVEKDGDGQAQETTQEKLETENNQENVLEISGTTVHEISDESVCEMNATVEDTEQKEAIENEKSTCEIVNEESVTVFEQSDSSTIKDTSNVDTTNTQLDQTDDVKEEPQNVDQLEEPSTVDQQISEPPVEEEQTLDTFKELETEKVSPPQDVIFTDEHINHESDCIEMKEPPTKCEINSEINQPSESVDVNKTNSETKAIKEKNIHESHSVAIDENLSLEDETSQPQDESSENSQVSQNSSADFRSKQSAKNILDDWEDTDSQQSDSKNVNSVNKLIDDWDDDDEENKKI